MDGVTKTGREIPGTARDRNVLPPKFQMTTRTHLNISTRGAIKKRAETLKLMNIVPDSANLTDEEIGMLAPPMPNAAKGIDIADIIDLRKRGLSHGAISKVLGCTKKNIQQRLKDVAREVDRIENFKTYKGDVLAIHQKRILDSLDKGTINKAGLRDRVLAFGVLCDKEEKITGKTAGSKGVQINIINYAGASQTGQVTRVEINPGAEEMTTQQMAMGD
jgi:hypothetical protein